MRTLKQNNSMLTDNITKEKIKMYEMMEMIKQDNLDKYKRLSQMKDVIDNEPKEVQTTFELVEAYFFEILDKY